MEKEKSSLSHLIEQSDAKEKSLRKRVVLFAFIPVAIAIILLLVIQKELKESALQIKLNQEEIDTQKLELDSLARGVVDLYERYDSLQISVLNAWGYSLGDLSKEALRSSRIQRSLSANREVLKILEKKRDYSSVQLRYYPKGIDQDKVVLALMELGFQPILLPPVRRLEKSPSNSIWFGANTDPEDIKLVAYSLLRAGIEIKSIRPFKNFHGPKIDAIEIGGDLQLVDSPPLTFEQIYVAAEFSR